MKIELFSTLKLYRIKATHKKNTFLLLFGFSINVCFGQSSFSFLNLPSNAFTNGIGGVNVSQNKDIIGNFTNNPALLDTISPRQIGINYSPYLAGIQYINANYSWKKDWAVGFQNLHYGEFIGTDALGNATTNFSVNDYNLYLAHAQKINNISFGVTTKLVGSFIENYSSLALLTDWGGVFQHPKKDFSFGIVAKNFGFLMKSYRVGIPPSIPFDLQLGITFKPQFMPLRFSITAQHLQQFDIVYFDPNYNYNYDISGNKVPSTTSVAEKVFRHFVIGSELLISKNINILVGYNRLRNKELSIQNLGGLSGFSAGIRIKYLPFDVMFSHAWFVSPSGLTSFSLNWKLSN